MSNIAYIRVSTTEQNTARQHELFKSKGIEIYKIFEEKISGKSSSNRPQLKAMLDYVREGDTVYIESISRLARNTRDFLNILQDLQTKNVELVSLKENIDTKTPQGKFILNVFASLSELERETIKERQREGIDICLKEGRPYGRPKVETSNTWAANYHEWKKRKITAVEFMRRENIKKTTFYKLVKEYERGGCPA